MAFRKISLFCILLLFLLVFTYSCKSGVVDETYIDKSFLEKEPCNPPCWYELELDLSTEKDTYVVLKKLPFVDQNSIFQQETAWDNYDNVKVIGYQCLYPKRSVCGRIFIAEDKVKVINTKINYDLNLFWVVNELGDPDYIFYFPLIHTAGCTITLGWPKKQISVSSDLQHDCPAPDTKIAPDTKVTSLTYAVFERFTVSPENQYPWPGFSKQ